jgi:hypothetical protein
MRRGYFDDFTDLKETGGRMFPPTEGLAPAESAPAFPAFAVRSPLATARNTYCFGTGLQCSREGAWLVSSETEKGFYEDFVYTDVNSVLKGVYYQDN